MSGNSSSILVEPLFEGDRSSELISSSSDTIYSRQKNQFSCLTFLLGPPKGRVWLYSYLVTCCQFSMPAHPQFLEPFQSGMAIETWYSWFLYSTSLLMPSEIRRIIWSRHQYWSCLSPQTIMFLIELCRMLLWGRVSRRCLQQPNYSFPKKKWVWLVLTLLMSAMSLTGTTGLFPSENLRRLFASWTKQVSTSSGIVFRGTQVWSSPKSIKCLAFLTGFFSYLMQKWISTERISPVASRILNSSFCFSTNDPTKLRTGTEMISQQMNSENSHRFYIISMANDLRFYSCWMVTSTSDTDSKGQVNICRASLAFSGDLRTFSPQVETTLIRTSITERFPK